MSDFSENRRSFLKYSADMAALAMVAGATGLAHAQSSPAVLRAAVTGFTVINTLDPAKASLLSEYYVIWGVFNGLVKFDQKMNIVPDLAESYVAIPGGFEFALRKGVKFHSGHEFTADDVVFTFERLADPATGSSNKARFENIKKVEVVDKYKVRIFADKGLATLLTNLTNTRTGAQIVSRAAFKAIGAPAFERRPIGTGAYKVTDWKVNSAVELEAFDGYFIPGKAKVKRIQVPIIPEESSGMRALMGGQVELTATAPFSDVKSLAANKSVKVIRSTGLNNRYVSMNVRRAPFDDVHFRRAFSMAINREVLVNTVLFGEGQASYSMIPPSLVKMTTSSQYARFNPEAAKAELAKSKYKDGAKGVILGWGSTWSKRFAEIVVAQVNQVLGTKFTIEMYDSNTVYSRIKAGDYDATVWGWLGLTDPDEYLGEVVGTGKWRNFQGYSNPKVDELLEKGRNTVDKAARNDVYVEAHNLVMDDMPVIPCFHSNVINLMSSKVQGFVQLPYGNFGDSFQDLSFV